ncbi:type II toxin-antitoxin system RelE/ParE family toxin [Viscerimonas tarda]
MEIEWLPEAIGNVRKIYIFYLSKNEEVANKILADINTSVERIALFPEIAAKEPLLVECEETFRSLVVFHLFKVVYYIDEPNDKIVVVSVFDCRQNPDKLKTELNNK